MSAISGPVPVTELISEIQEKRKKYLETQISAYQMKNPILSDIGECDREIAYKILHWDQRPLHGPELQARINEGKEQERKVIIELGQLGYDFIMGQQPILIPGKNGEILASGKIDGSIKWKGQEFPAEIKSMHPDIFKEIDTIDDFQFKPWLRKYPRQLLMYLFGKNVEQGLWVITNCLGAWKLIPIYLDYGECELILKRLESIGYNYLPKKELPPRIPYRKDVCGWCDFKDMCLPDIENAGYDFIDEPHLLDLVKRRALVEQSAKLYTHLDKEAKDLAKVKGKDFILGGEYKVEVKTGKMTKYEIPKEIKAQYAVEGTQMRVDFIPLERVKS